MPGLFHSAGHIALPQIHAMAIAGQGSLLGADSTFCGLLHHCCGQMGSPWVPGLRGGLHAAGDCGCACHPPNHDSWHHLWRGPRHHRGLRSSHRSSHCGLPDSQICCPGTGASLMLCDMGSLAKCTAEIPISLTAFLQGPHSAQSHTKAITCSK